MGEIAEDPAYAFGTHPSESFTLAPGRTVFWDDKRGVLLIVQDDPHWGTIYPPDAGKVRYDEVVASTKDQLDQGTGP